jgi:hypothetical protein
MRLLNAKTRVLEDFASDLIPSYAALSHTWGSEEITFQDLQEPTHTRKLGYAKIDGCCRRALAEGLEYVWVDTCCIDKSSSAELSEAINSMFQWYEHADVCYAYLADVLSDEHIYSRDSGFRKSRWYTRGWTLQELLAPSRVVFFDQMWCNLGTRAGLANILSDITGIGEDILRGQRDARDTCLAVRLSWAAKRVTTRKEDMAYCLLGILGVNMPTLYGEGDRAFARLQLEVIKFSTDQSFLAWGYNLPINTTGQPPNPGVLANNPASFENGGDIEIPKARQSPHFLMTNRGLQINLQLKTIDRECGIVLALLECHSGGRRLAIPLRRMQGKNDFVRVRGSRPIAVSKKLERWAFGRKIFIHDGHPNAQLSGPHVDLHIKGLESRGYHLSSYYPPNSLEVSNQLTIYRSPRREYLLSFGNGGIGLLVYVCAEWSTRGHELKSLKAVAAIADTRSSLEHLLVASSSVDFDRVISRFAWKQNLPLKQINVPTYNKGIQNMFYVTVFLLDGKITLDMNPNPRDSFLRSQQSSSTDILDTAQTKTYDREKDHNTALEDVAKTYHDGIQAFLLANTVVPPEDEKRMRSKASQAVMDIYSQQDS